MKQRLRPDLWIELEVTYAWARLEENWQALERPITLIRRAALEVSQRLGYTYPHVLDERAVAYVERIKTWIII